MRTFICFLAAALLPLFALAQPVKVEVVNQNGEWQLLRGGEPYYIKGAGGSGHLDKLVEIGGNSIRTWSADDAKEILDKAHEHGLTVMMGLWVQHERHGFDYNDEKAVQKQLRKFRKIVMKLKDHPALLLWGIGNEVDLNYSNTKVWYAINDIAKMIHEVDPNHPTSTVTAGLDSTEAALIMERAPEIDIYGINTYGDLKDVKDEIRQFGWPGPYIISEWGPDGHWEVEKTPWDAPIEQTSSEKAASYEQRYENFIASDKEKCLGSYVFLWGQKQETTATWYGLFSREGESSQAVDKLHEIWQGGHPDNRAPILKSAKILDSGKENFLKKNTEYKARVEVSDPDGDELRIVWEVRPESDVVSAGGDFEEAIEPIEGLIESQGEKSVTFQTPEKEGAYRLFVTIYDGNEHYAYANMPFYVGEFEE